MFLLHCSVNFWLHSIKNKSKFITIEVKIMSSYFHIDVLQFCEKRQYYVFVTIHFLFFSCLFVFLGRASTD